jgi:protein-L-isoaspartate O-methyltransferase
MRIGYEAIKFEWRNIVLGKSAKFNSIYQTSVGSYFPIVFMKFLKPHGIIFEFIANRNVLA